MKQLKKVPLPEVKAEGEYFMFDDETLTLHEMTGQEIIDAVIKKYDYRGWKEEEVDFGFDPDLSIEAFLQHAELENDEAEFYSVIFEKKLEGKK